MSASIEISVLKEYEKNPNIQPTDKQDIRNWLMKQSHLPGQFITDVDIILAFHCCGCCNVLTKKVIDLNYTLRTLFTFYQDRKLDARIEAALRSWLIMPLKETTKSGYRAIYCQLLDPDPINFKYADVVKTFVMIMDLWLSEEGTAPGTVIVLNMEGVSLGHLSRVDLAVAQQFFYFLQEAMFVRLKEFHFVNAPSYMDLFITMIKPFMKKQMLDMLRIHSSAATLYEEYFPQAALPEVTKETGELLRGQIWKKLKENSLFFEEESKKRVDELKRLSGPITLSSFFSSLESSFKKLDID